MTLLLNRLNNYLVFRILILSQRIRSVGFLIIQSILYLLQMMKILLIWVLTNLKPAQSTRATEKMAYDMEKENKFEATARSSKAIELPIWLRDMGD